MHKLTAMLTRRVEINLRTPSFALQELLTLKEEKPQIFLSETEEGPSHCLDLHSQPHKTSPRLVSFAPEEPETEVQGHYAIKPCC